MGTDPLVSVVVPFYNIEDCIGYCLGSLLAQTSGDYEVVCVDDGSTDGSGEALDRIAEGDGRIRVLHKENGGLSDARNFGVARSRGRYVSFVDGDDVVSPHYVEFLLRAMRETGCGQAVGFHVGLRREEAEGGFGGWSGEFSCRERGNAGMVADMLYGRPMVSAWGKLAPRELYLEHPYPRGLDYEDTIMFGEHVLPVPSFAVVDAPIYGYVARDDSITKRRNPTVGEARNFVYALGVLEEALGAAAGDVAGGWRYRQSLEYSRLYRMLARIDGGDWCSETKGRVVRQARSNIKGLLRDGRIPVVDKARLLLFAACPPLYCEAFDAYGRLKGRSK